MKPIVKKTWLYVLSVASLVFSLIFFAVFLPAIIDPAGHNPNLNRLQEGVDPAAYMHTAESYIAIVFACLATAMLILFVLDIFLRKKSSHVLMTSLSCVVILAYAITRSIYMISLGSLSTFGGILYAIAAIAFAALIYLFPKKTLDGDALWYFHVVVIVGFAFLFLGGATRSSYSLLNALGNGNNPVYWMGYLSSRSILLLGVVAWYANNLCSLEIEEEPVEEAA